MCNHNSHGTWIDPPSMLKDYGSNNVCSSDIEKIVDDGDYETFIKMFISGLVHQTAIQTGYNRPVGDSTAARIKNDLLKLIHQIKNQKNENLTK